jgi:integrase
MSHSSLENQINHALEVLVWSKEQIESYKAKHNVRSVKKALRPRGDPTRGQPVILSRRSKSCYLETATTFFQRAKKISGKGLLADLLDPEIVQNTYDTYYCDMMPDTNKTVLAALAKVHMGCRRLGWVRTPSPLTEELRAHIKAYRDDGDAHLPRFGYAEEDAPRIVERLAQKGSSFALAAEIALRCGLRSAEIAGLKGEYIDNIHNLIYAEGKGGKVRAVPIPPDLVERLDLSKQYLFVPSGPWKHAFYGAVRRAARELGITISGIHRLRANWAQNRYLTLTKLGWTDGEARDHVAKEAGHERRDVTYSYIPKGYS